MVAEKASPRHFRGLDSNRISAKLLVVKGRWLFGARSPCRAPSSASSKFHPPLPSQAAASVPGSRDEEREAPIPSAIHCGNQTHAVALAFPITQDLRGRKPAAPNPPSDLVPVRARFRH